MNSSQSSDNQTAAECASSEGFGVVDGKCERICRSYSCSCSNEAKGSPLKHILSCKSNGKCQVVSQNQIDCECRAGYAGATCNRCDDGYAGYPVCKPVKRSCSGRCRHSSFCDETRGVCICSRGSVGTLCTDCIPGFQSDSLDSVCIGSLNVGNPDTRHEWSGAITFLILSIVAVGVFCALGIKVYNYRSTPKQHLYQGIRLDDDDDDYDLGTSESDNIEDDDMLVTLPDILVRNNNTTRSEIEDEDFSTFQIMSMDPHSTAADFVPNAASTSYNSKPAASGFAGW